jgi:hypothetical protein
MDNLNTHKGKLAQQWLEEHPLVSFHYTPTHASWVNLAECFFFDPDTPGIATIGSPVGQRTPEISERVCDLI